MTEEYKEFEAWADVAVNEDVAARLNRSVSSWKRCVGAGKPLVAAGTE